MSRREQERAHWYGGLHLTEPVKCGVVWMIFRTRERNKGGRRSPDNFGTTASGPTACQGLPSTTTLKFLLCSLLPPHQNGLWGNFVRFQSLIRVRHSAHSHMLDVPHSIRRVNYLCCSEQVCLPKILCRLRERGCRTKSVV